MLCYKEVAPCYIGEYGCAQLLYITVETIEAKINKFTMDTSGSHVCGNVLP